MKRFLFNTGVNSRTTQHAISGGIDSGNGVIVIPFYRENVPDKSIFKYACDNPNLHNDDKNIIVREIHNSKLISKYAYFKLNN